MKIGIIGAGVAGLASAVRMAARGYAVEVFEANSYPGGKLSEFTQDGFRFDAGPSLFTMPHYVDELRQLMANTSVPALEYERLPVVCHYFWEDGTRLLAHADADRFAREVEEKLGVPRKSVLDSLRQSAEKYELTGRTFLEKSLHRLNTWLTPEVGRALLRLHKLDLLRTMDQVNRRQLKHPKLVQLFNRFATYNGSNPYRAPGLLTMIPHFEQHFGAYYPKGGMHAITRHMYDLALEKGVTFHFGKKVDSIETENGRATGLRVGGDFHAFDRVISNMDVFYTYRKLLPGIKAPERILRQEKSTSALIFYWGIGREFPELGLHNIFFSERYREEFEALQEGRLFEDPTVYINITSKCDPGDAPAGCENWFTMINVPYQSGQPWEEAIGQAREWVLQKLSRILGEDIKPLIRTEAILDPRGIEQKTSSHLGALYGASSNTAMAAFLRHPNFSRRIPNLYFCGGSAHPGGGIPLCLLSARIVDEVMHEY